MTVNIVAKVNVSKYSRRSHNNPKNVHTHSVWLPSSRDTISILFDKSGVWVSLCAFSTNLRKSISPSTSGVPIKVDQSPVRTDSEGVDGN